MSTTAKPPPKPAYADEREVEAAISALSAEDAERLDKYASYRARALNALGLGIDAKDLLQEALRRTVAGKRKWPKQISFVKHLIGTIRSISHGAAKKLKGVSFFALGTQSSTGDDRDEATVTWEPADTLPSADRIVEARQELARIRDRFANDERVLLILDALSEQLTGPEIKEMLGISQTELETAMTRLRRGARGTE